MNSDTGWYAASALLVLSGLVFVLYMKLSRTAAIKTRPDLGLYKSEELVVLRFNSDANFGTAMELLDGLLYEVPYSLLGGHCLLIPAEVKEFFAGLSFTEERVGSVRQPT